MWGDLEAELINFVYYTVIQLLANATEKKNYIVYDLLMSSAPCELAKVQGLI